MSRYWKSILAGLGTLATWGLTASVDGEYTQEEWWGLLAAVVATYAVYQKANTSPHDFGSNDENMSVTES